MEPDKLDGLLLRGFSGLDDYAAQFWIDHVLAYMKLTPVDARCAETTNELRIFAAAWKNSRSVPQGKQRTSQHMKDVSLQDTHPAIREMIDEVMIFWKQSKLYEATSNSYDCENSSLNHCHIAKKIDSTDPMANRSRSNLPDPGREISLGYDSWVTCDFTRQRAFPPQRDRSSPVQAYLRFNGVSMPELELQNHLDIL